MVREVTCVLFLLDLVAVNIASSSAVDGVYVDHSVTLEEAVNASRKLSYDKLGSEHQHAGCGKCSLRQQSYCLGDGVVHDHCCCDSKYLEWFPYMPHTCYLTRDPCTPIAKDCEMYNRIRVCCCAKLTAGKWKYRLSSATTASSPQYSALSFPFTLLIMERLLP